MPRTVFHTEEEDVRSPKSRGLRPIRDRLHAGRGPRLANGRAHAGIINVNDSRPVGDSPAIRRWVRVAVWVGRYTLEAITTQGA